MNALTEQIGKLYKGISKPVKAAFFSALLAGLIVHLPIIANRLFNHDSLTYLLADPNSTFALAQGKWLNLPVCLLLQGNIASTGIIVPLGVFLLALTAVVTVRVLSVKSSLISALIGILTVTFPSVMSANTFYSTAIFFFALLVASLSVLVTIRFRFGFLFGILLLTLSCGIYAAFIGYAAGLFVLYALLEILENRAAKRWALLSAVKYLSVLAVSAALYYLILRLVLNRTGIELSAYRGIDQVGRITPASLAAAVIAAYRKVYYFFRYGIFLYLSSFRIEPLFRVLNWIVLALCAGLSAAIAVRSGAFKKPLNVILAVLLALLFPLAIHAIAVLGQDSYTHWIMCYPFVLVYLYPLVAADRLESGLQGVFRSERIKKRVTAATRVAVALVLAVSALLIRQWYFTANQGYEFLRYADQNAISNATLLVEDIRESGEYNEKTPVCFAGTEPPAAFQYTTGDFSQVCGSNGDGYTGLRLPVVDAAHLKILLRDYIGVSLIYADEETAARISALPEVRNMPVYPAAGSIRMVQNCLVVKLSGLEADRGE